MTRSNAAVRPESAPGHWTMPIVPDAYPDRHPLLTSNEQALMAAYVTAPGESMTGWRAKNLCNQLARFDRPFLDTVRLNAEVGRGIATGRRYLFAQMLRTRMAFWAWDRQTWIAVIHGAPVTRIASGTRFWMINLAYLFADVLYVGASTTYGQMADTMFGKMCVDDEVNKLQHALTSVGYTQDRRDGLRFRWLCALVMLAQRSPALETVSGHTLVTVRQLLAEVPSIGSARGRQYLARLQTALLQLGILAEPILEAAHPPAPDLPALWASDSTIDPRWLAWVRAFFEQTARCNERTIRGTCYHLLTAGRWLKKTHPAITEPQQWTEVLAHAYVTYTCTALRGDQALPTNKRYAQFQEAPQQFTPRSINARLAAMRSFFAHLQRRPYIVNGIEQPKLQMTWLPHEAFRTPDAVMAAGQPNPRDIQEDSWLKLIWAACTLKEEQLQAAGRFQYPLAYVRAACLLWVSAARRSDEIRRLQVGCVSREWAPEMCDAHGGQLEDAAELCYLRVPTNKLRGEFYIPIPAYVADAIEVWEAVRPANQRLIADRKTRKPTAYLFLYRNELMGARFLNEHAIPLLCTIAGVSQTDVVGRITSHRARATTAIWMRKMGMAPSDIGRLLGHTNPAKSLPWYLREDKHQLGRAYRKANPLERYVAAILDPDAQAKQEPCVFYYLADGPDGRPRMCGNPHFSHCIHQMRCIECEAFIDHELAEAIERRAGVISLTVPIPLPPQVVANLNDQDEVSSDPGGGRVVPPPTIPGPAFHFNQRVPMRPAAQIADDLQGRLAQLEAQLAKKQGKADQRSAATKALMREIAALRAQIDAQRAEGRATAAEDKGGG